MRPAKLPAPLAADRNSGVINKQREPTSSEPFRAICSGIGATLAAGGYVPTSLPTAGGYAWRSKILEVRNRHTMVPAPATKLSPTGDTCGDYLLRRAGYDLGRPSIMLTRLTDGEGQYDPYRWTNRTMQTAHLWIADASTQVTPGS